MNNLAMAYRFTGQQRRAVPVHEEVLARSRLKLGTDHPLTITRMGNLAEIYRETGRFDESVPLFEEANALMKARLGPDHPDTLTREGDLASVYDDLGKLDQAHLLYQDVFARSKATLGADHPKTLNAIHPADSYSGSKSERALELAREIREPPAAQGRATFAGLCLRPRDARQDAGCPERRVGRRADLARSARNTRTHAAQRLADVQHEIAPRPRPFRPEEIRRRRTTAPGRVRGNQVASGNDVAVQEILSTRKLSTAS